MSQISKGYNIKQEDSIVNWNINLIRCLGVREDNKGKITSIVINRSLEVDMSTLRKYGIKIDKEILDYRNQEVWDKTLVTPTCEKADGVVYKETYNNYPKLLSPTQLIPYFHIPTKDNKTQVEILKKLISLNDMPLNDVVGNTVEEIFENAYKNEDTIFFLTMLKYLTTSNGHYYFETAPIVRQIGYTQDLLSIFRKFIEFAIKTDFSNTMIPNYYYELYGIHRLSEFNRLGFTSLIGASGNTTKFFYELDGDIEILCKLNPYFNLRSFFGIVKKNGTYDFKNNLINKYCGLSRYTSILSDICYDNIMNRIDIFKLLNGETTVLTINNFIRDMINKIKPYCLSEKLEDLAIKFNNEKLLLDRIK